LFIGVLFVTAVESNGAMAATDSTPSAGVIEEVVVTALRREQSLQDTSVSITAITGENLEKMGAKS
jgi:iron complex outermembrane receptor protein